MPATTMAMTPHRTVRVLATMLLLSLGVANIYADNGKKNVLFFIADDLRPQLNKAYGQSQMITPHFDKFAEEATVFDFAFCNFAICSASRNSFMTGRRPPATRVYNFIDQFRESGLSLNGNKGANWVTMPEYFKNAGYTALGSGKLYHPGKPPNNDEPLSWSQTQPYIPTSNSGCNGKHGGGRFCPDGVSALNQFSDVNLTNSAIDSLRTLCEEYSKNKTANFWFGVGLHYPHQPWHTAVNVTSLYPNPTSMPPAKHQLAPINAPDLAFTAELDGDITLSMDEDLPGLKPSAPPGVNGTVEYDCPWPRNNTVPDWFQQQLRLGYFSAVSMTDMRFGEVMQVLEETGVVNDTLVVVTGDHGWQLGEAGEWGKHVNFERGVQVPLMMRAPWKPASRGQRTKSFFELVDLYKTTAALAGLDLTALQPDVDGMDQSSLLDNPDLRLKNVSFAQYSRCPGDRNWPQRIPNPHDWELNNCETVPIRNISFMGYTVRDSQFRYTEWYHFSGETCAARWNDGLYARELYSHEGQIDNPYPLDFDQWELENVVNDTRYQADVERLHQLLVNQFDNENPSCPDTPPPDSISDLVLLYSDIGHDSCLCGTESCLKDKNAKYDYTNVGVQGYKANEGTSTAIPIYQFFNSSLHDNFVTTAKMMPNYDRVGTEPVGYILSHKPTDISANATAELQLWCNEDGSDHLTVADQARINWAKQHQYSLVASLGYIYTDPHYSTVAFEHAL